MHGLKHATGFIQGKLAKRLQTRFTPLLTFVLDQGVKNSIEVTRLINEALAQGGTKPAAEEQAQSARRMDERLARQERAAKRALSGICEGCGPGLARVRGRRTGPSETIGEDGLPYDPAEQ